MSPLPPYQLSAAEVDVILCLCRTGTLAEAGARMGVDGSTVFRTVQRVEKGLGQRLFERTRGGYQPTELALQLAQHGERIETELESARTLLHNPGGEVSGTVRITTTESLCYGMLLPVLTPLAELHPKLKFEINTGNEVLNLTKRDADIALRATRDVPDHLIGKQIGLIRCAAYTLPGMVLPSDPNTWRWIGMDEALPDHPTVLWRKHMFPRSQPFCMVSSIVGVMEAVIRGAGVGIFPLYLARSHPYLKKIMQLPDEVVYQVWLLTHPESRHLRRISTVYQYLADHLEE